MNREQRRAQSKKFAASEKPSDSADMTLRIARAAAAMGVIRGSQEALHDITSRVAGGESLSEAVGSVFTIWQTIEPDDPRLHAVTHQVTHKAVEDVAFRGQTIEP